jgi:hypothetical protein
MSSQEWGTINQEKPSAGEMERTFSRTLERRLRNGATNTSSRFDIDLPSREEIEGALKYLKNNKAAGADSIAVEIAELLKNVRPNLFRPRWHISDHF